MMLAILADESYCAKRNVLLPPPHTSRWILKYHKSEDAWESSLKVKGDIFEFSCGLSPLKYAD